MNEEILKLAKECGFNDFGSAWYDDRLEAFYRAAYNKAIEDAAKIADAKDDMMEYGAGEEIRELKKK